MCFLSAGYFIYDFFDMLLNQKLSQSWELLFHHVVVSQIFTSDPGWETHHSAEHTCGRCRHGEDESVRPRNKEPAGEEERETILPVYLLTPSHAPPPPSYPPTELDESHQSLSSSAYWPAAGEPTAKNLVSEEHASSTKPPQPFLLLQNRPQKTKANDP